jgi:hypothetical protein
MTSSVNVPQDDIEGCAKMIQEAAKSLPDGSDGILVRPIFAALPPEQQMKVWFGMLMPGLGGGLKPIGAGLPSKQLFCTGSLFIVLLLGLS